MCGIAGIVRLGERRFDPDAIERMCDAIEHRGPDDAGYAFFEPSQRGRAGGWQTFVAPEFRHLNEHLAVFGGDYYRNEMTSHDPALALGHRRLSILDLTHKGHQPMASRDRRYWIVYNGEIYNFRELRAQLEQRGHSFRTRSDTEVILALWDEYGEDALPMLNGMFALAIYDRHENRLTLARDRFGVKPLYWTQRDGLLLFGSEVKTILLSGLFEGAIDPASLVEYCTFQNMYGSRTIWKDVQLLEPGACLSVTPGEAHAPKLRRFFDGFPEVDPGLGENTESLREFVAGKFGEAVTRQLVSDVAVGSYLSGGMDSGSIVAVAGRSIPRIHTFTAGFDLTNVNGIEQGFDERPLAERLSYLLQSEHYAIVLHAGDMPAAMDKITWHMDDPRVGMCHQVWYVAKLASRFVKVCLAGAGGDELFAGYPWRYRIALDDPDEFAENYFGYWHRLLPRDELPQLFSEDLRGHVPGVRSSFESMLASAPPPQADLSYAENQIQKALHFEFNTFLNGLLVTEDKMSMAHSLESRVPFLDNELADLAFRIRPAHKLQLESLAKAHAEKGYLDSADGKLCLRRAMEDYLPKEFLYQQKKGFSPPDENWYRGPSMGYIQELLLDKRTLERPWFDSRFVKAKLNEHFEGRRNHRLLVWSLLSIEWIQRHFLEGELPKGNGSEKRRDVGSVTTEPRSNVRAEGRTRP